MRFTVPAELLKKITSLWHRGAHSPSKRDCEAAIVDPLVEFRHAVICELCGGLANQIICYKFGRYIAETQHRILILDASWYADQPVETNRNLQITKFELRYDAISFSKEWVQAILREHTTSLISGQPFHRFEDVSAVDQAHQLLADAKQVVHCDLWGGLTLRQICDDFAGNHYLHEFSIESALPELSDAHRHSQQLIASARNSVAVHVRRGNFATHDGYLLLTDDFFNKAIRQLEKEFQNPVFFVFSDEIEWCKLHLQSQSGIHFMDFNDERQAFGDLALAASCRHFILSHRSTFSHQMVELNRTPDGRRVIKSHDEDFERNQSA